MESARRRDDLERAWDDFEAVCSRTRGVRFRPVDLAPMRAHMDIPDDVAALWKKPRTNLLCSDPGAGLAEACDSTSGQDAPQGSVSHDAICAANASRSATPSVTARWTLLGSIPA